MSQSKFNALAAQIIRHEQTTDLTKQAYWFKHFARLVSLVRNSNIYGG